MMKKILIALGFTMAAMSAQASTLSLASAGPVTFTVAAGTYNERMSIPAIAGCTSTNTITLGSSTMTAPTASTATGCGPGTGTASVTPNGGAPGYTYLWDAAAASQTTPTAFRRSSFAILRGSHRSES